MRWLGRRNARREAANTEATTRATTAPANAPFPTAPIPTHWINTIPVESTDKPCRISSLDLKVHVSGLFADVTETICISNPNGRDLSVDIAIPLPDRAAVCGYALDIDGQMIDGVVVPKEKARVAFETEQRIGADPGLVEAVKGNVYRTRVYPVPGRKKRTVRLRYTTPLQIVDGQAAFLDAPMPSERLDERTVHVDVELPDAPAPELSGVNGAQFREIGTCWSVESHERNVSPSQGVHVALPKLPESLLMIERDDAGDVWFTASERVPAPDNDSTDTPAISTLTVLWDTSGSRAGADHEAEFELLRSYGESGAISSFRLLSFSDRIGSSLPLDRVEALVDYIASLHYDGGSDFQALSQALAEMPAANSDDGGAEAVVLFTDGLDTLSNEPFTLPQGRRIIAVVSGDERDAEALRHACGGLVFNLATAPRGAKALAQAFFRPNLLTGIAGEGVADVLGIGSGSDGRYTVVGKLAADSARISFENTGREFDLNAADARAGSTIAEAWAALQVAQLSPRADENADELLELGRRFGIVSPVTSLLVLETLDQWLRYDIEPPRSWASMHRQWESAREGIMRVSTEQGMREDHLRELRQEWARLREWWERDYSEQERSSGSGARFCFTCGNRVQPDMLFCPYCGRPLRPRETDIADDLDERAAHLILDPRDPRSFLPSNGPDYAYEELAAPAPAPMAMMAAAPAFDGTMSFDSEMALPSTGATASAAPIESGAPAASVQVQAWTPDADYLDALDASLSVGPASARGVYFDLRPQHSASPSFFIDCAGWFMAHGDRNFGLSVLSNLAELRIEDAALLRVMAWRLREAGELERALAILRRVLKLRPEDSQSHRDIALVLDELARTSFEAGDENAARALAEEAAAFYRELALTPWLRRPMAIGLFAVEEYNVLRAWANIQTWKTKPALEPLDANLEGILSCDLRITLAWDADETDVDLHVTEPTGEEAYFAHPLTRDGGRVSEDITDGYGPELYAIRRARPGTYNIRAHYYASHQQTVFGPASCTLTIYTDWGRPTQKQQITSIRLENEREMVPVGTATYRENADEPK